MRARHRGADLSRALTNLGVALYQSSKQARQITYRVALATIEPGMVCFVLTREGP